MVRFIFPPKLIIFFEKSNFIFEKKYNRIAKLKVSRSQARLDRDTCLK